jgi:hypothetical protein
MVIVFFILIAYIVVEFILFARGKSIGKAILGLQVVSSNDGKPFRFWKMFFRECFVKSASGSVFGLGYIWILVDEKNRGWHDKILDSYVVDLKESERMNLKRHLEKARAQMPEPEPVREVRKADPVSPEVQHVEEPAVEVTPEVVKTETAAVFEEAEEKTVDFSAEETAEKEAEETAEAVPEDTDTEIPEWDSEETVTEVAETSETIPVEVDAEVTEETEKAARYEIAELNMSMKKEELLEAARSRGVQVSARATKAAIIEAIEKAAADEETK